MASDPPKILISATATIPRSTEIAFWCSPSASARDGIDCTIDQYVVVPPEGPWPVAWPRETRMNRGGDFSTIYKGIILCLSRGGSRIHQRTQTPSSDNRTIKG